jgi:hypothetical protein
MPKKYVISYRATSSPIGESVTKFGGLPVWIEKPQWPLSRRSGAPMQFICQVVLYANLFGDLDARMAYVFLTDWDFVGVPPYTGNPDSGENAVIVQPGGIWTGPSLPLYEGPGLYRRQWRSGRWEQTPCEFDVDLLLGEDPEQGAWDDVDPDDADAWSAYWEALVEDKIGGTPVPTGNAMGEPPRVRRDWPLLLQLYTKGDSDPFFLNFASDGVGYAYISPDGRIGTFLWDR